MKIQSLANAWKFRQAGTVEWLPACVPGGVHTDLMALGRIPDPFAADNEQRVQWVAESDWIYRSSFNSYPELLAEEKVYLVCEGLDTLAKVVLNGHELGQTDNMFRRYEWEVKSLLGVEGANELTITFNSPLKYAAEKQAIFPLPGVPQAIPWGPVPEKGSLSIWLGLGSPAPAGRHLEGYPPGGLQRSAPC
jgi:beta-mannosidase